MALEKGFSKLEFVPRPSRDPQTPETRLPDQCMKDASNMGKVTRITARAVPPPKPLNPMTLGQAVFRACLVWGAVLAGLAAWVSWGPQ